MENQVQQPSLRKPSVAQISILYSICVLLFLFLGGKVQSNELFSGILITEFVLVLIPPIALLLFYRYDLLKLLRIKKISLSNCILILLTMVSALPVVGAINALNMLIIKAFFGKVSDFQIPIPSGTQGLLLSILIIGGSAGICEEILFRGTIQRGFERFGAAKSIIITAFLFGLMHLDFERLAGTFMLGAIIGFLVYRTDSIFAGILAHFINNSIAVIATYFAKIKNPDTAGIQDSMKAISDIFTGLSIVEIYFVIIVWIVVIMFFASIFAGVLYAFIKNTSGKTENLKIATASTNKLELLWLLPALLAISFMFVKQGIALIAG